MTITLYTNTSNKKTLNKSLTTIGTYECVIKDATDILRPVLLIMGESNLATANYFYLSDWRRFYYAEVGVTPAGWTIRGEVDALMSWKSSILSLNTYISRQENVYNRYIIDNNVTILSQRGLSYQKIGTLGDDYSTILTVTGSYKEETSDG